MGNIGFRNSKIDGIIKHKQLSWLNRLLWLRVWIWFNFIRWISLRSTQSALLKSYIHFLVTNVTAVAYLIISRLTVDQMKIYFWSCSSPGTAIYSGPKPTSRLKARLYTVCPKSPASWFFTQPFIQAQIKENTKAPLHWLCAGNSPHKGPVTREMFPFDDVIMINFKLQVHFPGINHFKPASQSYVPRHQCGI